MATAEKKSKGKGNDGIGAKGVQREDKSKQRGRRGAPAAAAADDTSVALDAGALAGAVASAGPSVPPAAPPGVPGTPVLTDSQLRDPPPETNAVNSGERGAWSAAVLAAIGLAGVSADS